jgi:hypothetical protein
MALPECPALPAPRLPVRRVQVALPPGAATLVGSPRTGGLAWAGRFSTTAAAIVALIRRALAVEEPAR